MYRMHMIWSTKTVTQNYGKSSQMLSEALRKKEERPTVSASNSLTELLAHFVVPVPMLPPHFVWCEPSLPAPAACLWFCSQLLLPSAEGTAGSRNLIHFCHTKSCETIKSDFIRFIQPKRHAVLPHMLFSALTSHRKKISLLQNSKALQSLRKTEAERADGGEQTGGLNLQEWWGYFKYLMCWKIYGKENNVKLALVW